MAEALVGFSIRVDGAPPHEGVDRLRNESQCDECCNVIVC
jgi:hypothetical protein